MNRIYGACLSRVQRVATIFILLALCVSPAMAGDRKTVLVFGDSLSAAHGLAEKEGWVALTATRMRSTNPDWRLVNASISGETSAGGAERINAELARTHPAVLVVELGANDGLRGLPLAQMNSNLATIIRAAKADKAKVLLLGMRLPPNMGGPYARGFAQNYTSLSKQYNTAYLPFLLAPIAADRNAFQADNLHPTAAVQPKLRDHVWAKLQPLLK